MILVNLNNKHINQALQHPIQRYKLLLAATNARVRYLQFWHYRHYHEWKPDGNRHLGRVLGSSGMFMNSHDKNKRYETCKVGTGMLEKKHTFFCGHVAFGLGNHSRICRKIWS